MKNIFLSIFDTILIIAGPIIIFFGFTEWQEAGYEITVKGEHPKNWGNEAIIIILLGIGSISYGILDFLIFRKTTKKESTHQ